MVPATEPQEGAIELSSEELIDADDGRNYLLDAAASSPHIVTLTGTHGVITPPLLAPRVRLPDPSEIHPGALTTPADEEIGRLRALVAMRTGDPVGELRARLELARAELERGHEDGARREATLAAAANEHSSAAHAMLRSLRLGRTDINEQLVHVDKLVAAAARSSVRADWICERARLLQARDGVTADSVAAWKEALALVPDHSGALFGVEVALERSKRWKELGGVLGALAELASERDEAAWLHVERAILLDRQLGELTSARAALDRALEMSPGLGPVRSAYVDFAVRHRDGSVLAELLEAEAQLEPDRGRAARLELDAALAGMRARVDQDRILSVLERAHRRAPTTPLLDQRVADELARLYDEEARHVDALRVRQRILGSITEPRELSAALRTIASTAERAGATDDAVAALERAMDLDPRDETLLADLDRLLLGAKRHEARAVLWLREAARVEEPEPKARALLVAAEAYRAGGKEDDAARQREAAWLTAPTAPGVYDALASRIGAVAPTEAVNARIGLYERSVGASSDPARKIHFLEKLAWLKDDVVGDAAGAARAYEEILSLEPARLSAIIGLASAATRGGDARGLSRSLAAQADVTEDPTRRAELRLRAAETLAPVDPERALAQADALQREPAVKDRAADVVTLLHALSSRWELVAEMLSRRAAAASAPEAKIRLVLAEVDVLLGRLRAPERALAAISRLPANIADDAGVRAASLASLEMLGDEARLRAELGALAERAQTPAVRARLFLRAGEIDEQRGRDVDAVRSYERARAALPVEPLIDERIRRIGARTPLTGPSAALVSPLQSAMRALDTADPGNPEQLLATGATDIATLRLSERLARRIDATPIVANALAMSAASHPRGILARRAYEGLATLTAWTLPPTDDYGALLHLLALGSTDVAAIDALVKRAHDRVRANDPIAVQASIEALVRRAENANDDTERLVFHLDLARLRRRAGTIPESGGDCKRALAADPSSLTAACLLAEVAAELDDDDASIQASRALAAIVQKMETRAELLQDAGDLAIARGDRGLAAELFEQALVADPENVQIAARLASLQRARKAHLELGRVLLAVLGRARTPEAIIPIASELADVARRDLHDPLLAIAALERLREVAPGHVAGLLLLSELFIGQRSWDKALVVLAQIVTSSPEPNDRLVALVGRATIYRKILGQPALAEAELRAALEIDDHDLRAIRGLLDLGEAIAPEERAELFGRFVGSDIAPGDRLRALLELSTLRRSLGDVDGAEGALVEATSLSPDPHMFERVRSALGGDLPAVARVLSKAIARAHEHGRTIDPSCLVALGTIELDLRRLDDAVDRFEEALRADESRDDARVLLARALSARGDDANAALALGAVIATSIRRIPVDLEVVRLLERSLAGAGRPTERWVARELRAIGGDLAPGEHAELDGYLGGIARTDPEGLSAAMLRSSVMPAGFGRHPVWDVAALASGLAGKLARIGLSEQGSSTRDRLKPRTPHPLRLLFDRLLRAFGLEEVELAVSEHIVAPAIACEDVPWLIVPAGLSSAPEPHAVAVLARPLTRIALGVPWLGALVPNEVLALLVGFARVTTPSFTAGPPERIEPFVDDYGQRARRAIDRKRRRALDELDSALMHAPVVDDLVFAEAIAATEARAAFLLSGSVRAALDAIAPSDAMLADALRLPLPETLELVFGRPASQSLTSFALSSEATGLRRSLGTA